jgi:hypothetical protein
MPKEPLFLQSNAKPEGGAPYVAYGPQSISAPYNTRTELRTKGRAWGEHRPNILRSFLWGALGAAFTWTHRRAWREHRPNTRRALGAAPLRNKGFGLCARGGDGGGPRGGSDAHGGACGGGGRLAGRGGWALNDVELEPKSLGRHVLGARGDGL